MAVIGTATALVTGCGTSAGPGLDDSTTSSETGTDTDAHTETGNPGDTGGPSDTSGEGEAPECVTKSDCGPGQICLSGECDDGPEVAQCHDDSACFEGICVNEVCVYGLAPLEACAPLTLTTTELFQLVNPFAWAIGDLDGEPGDEIVAYQPGQIVSVANGELMFSPHPASIGGVRSATVLRADPGEAGDLVLIGAGIGRGLHSFLGDGAGGFTYLGVREFEPELYASVRATAPTSDALIVQAPALNYVFVDALADAPALTIPSFAAPTAGDLDGDGIDELALVVDDSVQIWSRAGDSYTLLQTLDCAVNAPTARPQAVIADVDGDGDGDLVCLTPFNDDLQHRLAVSLLLNLGDLEFERQPTLLADNLGPDFNEDRSGAIADLEGDGDLEFVFGRGNFMRLGDHGNFACLGQVDVAGPPKVAKVADLDGDGRDELVSVGDDRVLRIHALE